MASDSAAADFVAGNLTQYLPTAPSITAALHSSVDLGAVGELYASIRFYEGFDLMHFAEANDLTISQLLPALQDFGDSCGHFLGLLYRY